ncbi:MAG: serine/threonine-protein phosphatase [Planctomycetes bacterium]|nr:serine/threonine-protein phosphatase [Planctomycetota bacterium]
MFGFDDIEYASLSDVGVRRSHNQDSLATLPATDLEQWRIRGHVFLVADGMGAHAVGELASKLAADSIPHIYSKHAHEGAIAAIRRAFVEANLCIHNRGQQNREFAGMGTTGTALLLRPEGLWVGHVGDSRCYRIRKGKIEQLSFDHSLVWELARRQNKPPEELLGVPSNVIVRSLGPEPFVQVDVEGPHPIEPGDVYVLCSDGLSGPVTDREIGAVAGVLPPEEACRFLIHLANLQGGPDNITVVAVRVAHPSEKDAASRGGPNPGNAAANPLAGSDALSALKASPGARLVGLVLRFPWPFFLLVLGIALAVIAIYFTAFDIHAEVPAFVGAAVALMAGLGGLMLQSVRERHEESNPAEQPRPLNVYRQTDCTVDDVVLERLQLARTTLEERIRERNWQADGNAVQYHLQVAESLRKRGDRQAAFRELCRAVLHLMDAIGRQRNKEESFKPLYDQTPLEADVKGAP